MAPSCLENRTLLCLISACLFLFLWACAGCADSRPSSLYSSRGLQPYASSQHQVKIRVSKPVIEARASFMNWLRSRGLRPEKERAGKEGGVSFMAQGVRIRAEIIPYTALGSQIILTCPDQASCERMERELRDHFQPPEASSKKGAVRSFSISGLDIAEAPEEVKKYLSNTVCVHITGPGGMLQCSGLFIQALNKVISTAHNIESVHQIRLSGGNGYSFSGRLKTLDRQRDLALIEVAGQIPRGLVPPKREGLPEPGERIYFVGCPLDQGKVVVSGVVEGLRDMKGQLLIQARIHVEPGASGSPVYDSRGRLIGLIKGRLRGNRYQGFIIPMDTVEQFLDDVLINHKQ